jgi:hypothetical protein
MRLLLAYAVVVLSVAPLVFASMFDVAGSHVLLGIFSMAGQTAAALLCAPNILSAIRAERAK